jgi:thiamine-phosphate pyrophosphorylase
MNALPLIWIITDPDHAQGPIDTVQQALVGCPAGKVGVQLRAKSVDDRTLVQWARRLRELTKTARAPLVINQRPDVAALVAADGVHLPESSMPIAQVRESWPQLRWLGQSRHDREGLLRSEKDEVSYAFLSPVFEVPDKGPGLGVDGFREAVAGISTPVYALGGISADSAQDLRDAGAHGVAVRRAVYRASHPSEVIAQLLAVLDKPAP